MGTIYTLVWQDEEGEVPIGYMLRPVFEKLMEVPESIRGRVDLDPAKGTVSLLELPTEAERTRAFAKLNQHMREHQTFKILRGWRDELWPVYGRGGELLFSMERSAMGLYGNMRYGVHMTAYVRAPGSSHGMKLWVAKRAATKSTYPGMLDNTAAGGLMTGEDPFECMVREADEEASIPQDLMRKGAKEVGTIAYIYITDARSGGENGLVYPECQWIYELELPEDVVPQPQDGEAEGFTLCSVEETQALLAQGRFKPNCAVVLLDFFVRHGILTRENEPDYDEIIRRMHRRMPFPGPHQRYEE